MKRKNYGKDTKMRLRDISETSLFKDLKDPNFAAEYLEEILKEGNQRIFLEAIRNVARANGGMKKLAKYTKLSRESMYKAFSKKGNPQFSTVQLVLNGLGLELYLRPKLHGSKAA